MNEISLILNWGKLLPEIIEREFPKFPDTAELYELCEDLLEPCLHPEDSWWYRNVVRTSTVSTAPTASFSDPFSPIHAKNPNLLPYLAAIVSDRISDQAFDVLASYTPKMMGRDLPALEYMLDFMSSGIDPPEGETPAEEPKKSGGAGGPEEPEDPEHKAKGPYTLEKAKELAKRFKQHLNKLDSPRETIVYAIYRVSDGKLMKFGETARGFYKSPKLANLLKRAQEQINRAYRRGDTTLYKQRIVKRFASKKDAKEFETQAIDRERTLDRDALPWNKGRT